MQVNTYIDRSTMSLAAATHAAGILRSAIREQGGARIVAATVTSQFEFLDALTAARGIDWTRVEMFHLDEYVGLAIDHPASFRKYLLERLIRKTGITRYHLLDAEHDAARTADCVGEEVARAPSTWRLSGSAKTGSRSTIRPPTSRPTALPIVTLDAACRHSR
jgi:glucosamine-6-phosphate deaminase